LIVTCSNGFNSVLDLSTERKGANTQRSLFKDSEWKELKNKYKSVIDWMTLTNDITEKLETIEEVSYKF
jgi:hypothetical protein